MLDEPAIDLSNAGSTNPSARTPERSESADIQELLRGVPFGFER